jgi:hypothetical protein
MAQCEFHKKATKKGICPECEKSGQLFTHMGLNDSIVSLLTEAFEKPKEEKEGVTT